MLRCTSETRKAVVRGFGSCRRCWEDLECGKQGGGGGEGMCGRSLKDPAKEISLILFELDTFV
jgi:hypothetical protein